MAEQAIAIVGMGCVLPGAENPEEFWSNCLSSKSAISPLSRSRWDSSLYLSDDRFDVDKTYSTLAAEVAPEVYANLSAKYNLKSGEVTRMELLLIESCHQALLKTKQIKDRKKIGFTLGVMSPDEEHFFTHAKKVDIKILKYLRDHLSSKNLKIVDLLEKMIITGDVHSDYAASPERIQTSEILEKVAHRFQVQGLRFIIDAACASSLASIEQCCKFLSSGEWDMAIAGGVETNLSPGSFSLFSRVGGLALNHCLPFDKRTEGLVQGEGAGIVILKRLETAIADQDQILAVIAGIDGSSDGKTSSLFQPNDKGQKLALSRVYTQLPLKKLSYLEGHGTGTVLGDKIEIGAISDFFSSQYLPMGSVKGLIGHTKAAAGIANLIKVLMVMREGVIPGMPYMSQPLVENDSLELPSKNIKLTSEDSQRFGISAFGFGGTNYHMAIESFNKNFKNDVNKTDKPKKFESLDEVFIVGEAEISFNDFDSSWFTSTDGGYRLPPQSIPFIDKAQLLAVKAAELAIQAAKLKQDEFPNEEVMVISSSILGLNIVEEQTGRVRSSMLIEAVKKHINSNAAPEVIELIEKFRSAITPFNEDSAAGVLNNVIAGRVCNAFDFHGKSYNIESRNQSHELTLKLAIDELSCGRTPVIFLITIDEDINFTEFRIDRNKVKCQILCNKSFSMKNFLRPIALLSYEKINSNFLNPSGIDFEIRINKIQNTNINHSAILFPGQGSIFPNRYANYIGYSLAFMKRFELADRLAIAFGLEAISSLALQDTKRYDSEYPTAKEALMLNLFQLTVESALFDLLLERGIQPEVLTGHSFGEFSALSCAGIYSFERAFEIVCLREEASPDPGVLGTLVVVATSVENIEAQKLNSKYHIANINSKDQVVLSLENNEVQSLLLELRKKRIPAKELRSVGRPYHSSLMFSSAEKFKKNLELLTWEEVPSLYGFISSVNGQWYPPGSILKKDELVKILAEQFVKPVYFTQQIKSSIDKNIQGFLELGLDRTLSGFVEAIVDKGYTVVTAEDLLLKKKKNTPRKIFKLESNKYIEMVAKIVSTITGYKFEEITLEQQFEEDLRIDSIKKAEIFFRCLEESQGASDPSIEISNFKQVGDIVEFFQNNETNFRQQVMDLSKPSFSLYTRKLKKSELLYTAKKIHPELIRISLTNFLSQLDREDVLRLTRSFNDNNASITQQTIVLTLTEEEGMHGTSDLTERLVKLGRLIKELTSRYRNPIIVLYSTKEDSLFGGYRSFLKSLRLEMKNFTIKSIIDSNSMYFKTWEVESEDLLITDVVWKNKTRFTSSLEVVTKKNKELTGRVIFSIGGSRGILKQYFSSYNKDLQTSLFLTGRSSIEHPDIQETINELKVHFGKVIYFQMNAMDEKQVRLGIEKAIVAFGKIDLLIDASGMEVSKLFENKSNAEIEQEIASKVIVRKNIQSQFDFLGLHSQKEIYFNSIAATYGNHGQSVYAFTNAYVSASKRGLHLSWPPLDGLGMTSDLGILMKLKMMGVDLLPKNEVEKFLTIVSTQDQCIDHNFEIVSLKSHFMMNLISAASEFVKTVFGQVLFGNKAHTMKILDKEKAPYLQDHVVNSNCIAPGSMGLASFVLAAKVFFQRMPAVVNFKMHNFILLDRGPIEVFMSLNFKDSQNIHAKSYSKYDNYEVDLIDIESINHNMEIDQISNVEIEREFDLNEFYSPKFIDYGPSFRVLNSVGISEENSIYTICNTQAIQRTGEFEFDYLTTFYEAGVQSAAAKCLLETKSLALPIGIGSLSHYTNEHSDIVYFTTGDLVQGEDLNNFSVDIFAYNINGKLIAKMEAIKFKKFVQLKEFPLVVKKVSSFICQ